MTPPAMPPEEYRTRRRTEAEEQVGTRETALRRISTLRVWAFLATVVPLLLLETSPRSWWPALLGMAAVGLVAFGVLLVRHRRERRELDGARIAVRIQEEALARLRRDWDAAPAPELGPVSADHPWGDDLNATGRGSLAHLLGTVTTAPGRAALRDALLHPGRCPAPDPAARLRELGGAAPARVTLLDPDEAASLRRERREAVDRLSGHPEWCDELHLAGRLRPRTAGGPADPGALATFLEWARGPGWDGREGWTLPVARVLGVATPALLVAWLAGWLAAPVWVVPVAGCLLLHRRIAEEAGRRFDAAEAGQSSLGRWSRILEVAARIPGDDPLAERIRSEVGGGVGEGAPAALERLRSRTDWAAIRRSGLTHFPLVALFCWDAHHLARIEAWREEHGSRVAEWARLVGEVELLAALAVLRHDHPDWTFGDEAGPQAGIRATEVRHPLLAPHEAVPNDVEVPEPGALLLVTGSNMSGKSTLLRALGANQILFLAGGPVAASEWTAPPVRPWTAMRIRDSLTRGVSFFLAELQRLRAVVDGAREGPTLVLLDEILQGTNTAERRIAARMVLEHLLEAGAIGAVSTHDLTLGREPSLESRMVEVHLREDVQEVDGQRTLHFDHRLRPGPATSKNALLLMELVGLGRPGDADDPTPDRAEGAPPQP